MPGTYTVAKTTSLSDAYSIWNGIVEQTIATKVYNNENDFLKELDLRMFGWGCEGLWQYRTLGQGLQDQCVIPLTTGAIVSVSQLPVEEID